MLVVLKSVYRLGNKRLREGGNLKEGHQRIDALIKAVVTREIPDDDGATIDYWEPGFEAGHHREEKEDDEDDDGEGDPMKYHCTIDLDGVG